MAAGNTPRAGASAAQYYSTGASIEATGRNGPTNLGDILERVLDKGLVIAGDIQVNLLDIELLTIKLRLVIASLDTAREVGINWWENDPWLSAEAGRDPVHGTTVHGEVDDGSTNGKLRKENRLLRDRISELESGQ